MTDAQARAAAHRQLLAEGIGNVALAHFMSSARVARRDNDVLVLGRTSRDGGERIVRVGVLGSVPMTG